LKKHIGFTIAGAAGLLAAAIPITRAQAGSDAVKRVLLISIDGMHSVDLKNCINGVESTPPSCPNLAALASTGITYPNASTSKPSDSFPGLLSIVTGGSPFSADIFYDDSYDRTLAPPLNPDNGINGGATGTKCVPGVPGPGTELLYDESLDTNWDPGIGDSTSINGGGISTLNLARDPMNGCKPVYPHSVMKVNTIFEVVKAAGGHTAWSDKHPAYDLINGPSGKGVDDLFTPEINSSINAGIAGVTVPGLFSCSPAPDPDVENWTLSFKDVKCYDQFKVNALLHEIDGKDSSGSKASPVPTLFGMNFQAVSVGQKLVQKVDVPKKETGGYQDAAGNPTSFLLGEIKFVDGEIGQLVDELKKKGLYESTLIIITAKHGQAPIDPSLVNKPGDVVTPVLGAAGISLVQATEDDIALLWLADQSQTDAAANILSADASGIFLDELFSGKSILKLYQNPLTDARTPDIVVQPTLGTIYTTSGKKIAEHGGFSDDDTNVILLASNPSIQGRTIEDKVSTQQIAPSILSQLGLDPNSLQAVQIEHVPALPGLR
jgi:predicted AlkP superfamily pyrophosphatase or phosphodiesterase